MENQEDGSWTEFRVEGDIPLKGTKHKRDGPMWSINSTEEERRAVEPTKPRSKAPHAHEHEDRSTQARRSKKRNKKKKRGKNKNAYQKKRGIKVTKEYAFFAGTVFLSSPPIRRKIKNLGSTETSERPLKFSSRGISPISNNNPPPMRFLRTCFNKEEKKISFGPKI